jgi:hypothetical protein
VPSARTSTPKPTLLGGLLRVTAATLSAGAALVSILSYTGMRATIARGSEGPPPSAERAHRLSLVPPADTATAVGDTIQLAALVTDDRGAALLGVAPAWTSADPAVVEVDQAGTVVSRGPGSTVVIVRVGRLEARARVIVEQRPVALRPADSLIRVAEGERGHAAAVAADARGNPIAGAPLRWQAADAAVAAVDSLGEVTGVSPGRSTLAVTLGDLRADVGVEVVPVPASITVLAGEDQRGPAGRVLPTPVTAQVVSRTGRPIPGATARFEVRGAGSASPVIDTADARGTVSTQWSLDSTPGRKEIAVVVEGVPVSPVVTAEADPLPRNTRVALASELVPATAGDSLLEPVVVRVTDSLGMALADLPITWTALDGGRVSPLGARTDSTGEARGLWRLGPRAGRQRIRVQVGNARSMPPFTASTVALAGRAESLAVIGGNRQSGKVGTPLAKPVVVRVLDRAGNPVPGVSLAVSATGGTADSLVQADSTGLARIRWTLGRAAGPQTLSVGVREGKARLQLAATGRAAGPARVAFVGAPGSAAAGRQLSSGIGVEVTDSFGNPVGGQRLTLVTTSGALSPSRAVTDQAGRAKIKWTPGRKAGTATLTATLAGTAVRGKQTISVTAPRPPRD